MSKNFKINTKNIENLFAIAKNEGVSAASILENLHFSSTALSEWKKGKACPTIEALMGMADYFNVSVDYLLCRENTISETEIKIPTSKKRTAKKMPEDNDEIPYSDNARDMMNKTTVWFEREWENKTKTKVPVQVNTQCPICHHDNQPVPAKLIEEGRNTQNFIGTFICGRCHHTFSVLYKNAWFSSPQSFIFSSQQLLPTVDSCYTPYRSAVPKLPKTFNKPEFEKFRQAYEDLCWAKDYQIEGLVGMAYRRVIDFLIRDYFLYAEIDFYKDIKTVDLHCLIEAIDEKEIRTFAERVNWLANDYTHYVDEHPDCTIADIEEFFNIVLRVLAENISYNKALKIQSKYQKKHNIQQQSEPIAIKKDFVPAESIAEDYKHLWRDDSFTQTAMLFNEYTDSHFRNWMVATLILWADIFIKQNNLPYSLPNDILSKK